MLQNYLDCLDNELSVICVTETWLTDADCDLYGMSGYIFSEYHRNNRSGGGVGIYIRDCLDHTLREDLSLFNDDLEAVFVEVPNTTLNLNKNVIIGTIYRPPGSDLMGFNEWIQDLMDRIVRENKICYLAGDFNINLLNHDTHQLTAEFLNIMYSNSFIPLINRPTRITEHSATLIDNVFTNGLTNIIHSFQGILISDITDHFPVFTINRSFSHKETEAVLVKRSYSERNKQSFLQLISDLDWNEIYNCCDTQQAFSIYYEIFTKHYDACFPKKEIKIKYNNRKPWLSAGLKQSIKIKNKLYKKSIKIKSSYYEMKYKLYKNKTKQLLLKAEKKYYADILAINKGNMKKIWSIMKGIIGKNKQKKLQEKFKLSDGTITSDKYIISERFNDFFIGIGPSLAGKIPSQSIKPKQYLENKLMKSIFLAPVTSLEIGCIIKNLRESAPGHDEVTASILQLSLPFITDPLVFILNMSMSQGLFPAELKIANVLPLYKTDDCMVFNNYRPVSILCMLSKVFEKVMYSRLIDFLEENKILIVNQFGFRKNHSSYMALMVLIDKLTKALENGDYVIGMFLDFSKAFDTVNHQILLEKLEYYGIRGSALAWFESYLADRQQYVTCNGVKSSCKTIKCGVPQGSILGPLLFLLYINDLANICKHTLPVLFADDTNLFNSGKDLTELQDIFNAELKAISTWLKVNKLSLNVKKTHYMVISTKKKPVPDISIYIEGHLIDKVSCTKFLCS